MIVLKRIINEFEKFRLKYIKVSANTGNNYGSGTYIGENLVKGGFKTLFL